MGASRGSLKADERENSTVAFDLVERIYAAGEEPGLWTVFLERLAWAVHGTASAMVSDEIHAAQPKEQGEMTSFDVPGATETRAYGVSATGDIVGYYSDLTGTHGFLLSRRGPE